MNHNIFFFLFLLVSSPSVIAQKIDVSQLKGLKIRSIGPAGMSGRVTTIDVVNKNPEHIFAGTASGGVWTSRDGGTEWKPVFDEQPVQSIGALAINQKNPSELWVGTGEGNPRNSQNSGNGIYKSLDGGKTWKHAGLESSRTIHRIIIHRDNPDIVYVASPGSAWGPNPERGVFRTTDGGKSWEKILFLNDSTGCADLVVDPENPNKLIAAMWEYGRKPWTFHSGGKYSGIHISYDGGDTWQQVKEGLPKGDLGRIGLAIAPSKPQIVYALVEAKTNGLYKSTDGGHKWKLVSDKNIGNRPFYYSDIFVDPKNENRIFNLHSTVTISQDGGKSFSPLLPFYSFSGVHPDHHAFWIHPEDPDYLIEGNDGGLYISRNGGESWRFAENLPLAQFYHINYDMDIPYNVCGGMQDNGSWIGPSAVWKYGGIKNSDWQEVLFGDGFDVVIKPDNNRYGYAMSQGGNLSFFNKETGKSKFIKPVHPEGLSLRFNWNAGIAQDPFNNCGVYFGSQFLHYSKDCGQSWKIISPDLTTNDTTKQQQALSGGLTIDATHAENFTTILAIAPHPKNKNEIWVGTDDGNLQYTTDGGQNWENLSNRLPDFPKGSWIPQIVISEINPAEVFVIVNDYRRNNWEPYVYHTTDSGQTFRRIADGKDVDGHALSIVQDPVEPGLLFLGTDHGLHVSFDHGENWNKWTNDFPSVSTTDLKIHPREHDLIAGTFGRAAYILDDIRPLRAIAQSRGEVLSSPFKVFEAPDAYLAHYRSVSGSRFVADASFSGTNRSSGAMLTLWLSKEESKDKPGDKAADKLNSDKNLKEKESEEKPSEDKKTEEKKEKKKSSSKNIQVRVINTSGDTIRTFSIKPEKEIMRVYWSLTRDGVEFPSMRERKKDSDPPQGGRVLPGQYKLIFSYKTYTDSTFVNVLQDPRAILPLHDLKKRQDAEDDYYALIKKATEAFNLLKEAKKTISLVNNQLVNLPDSTKESIQEAGKILQDSIQQYMEVYRQPRDKKGIDSVTPSLTGYMWRASSYLRSSDGPPNENALMAIKQVREETERIVGRINIFLEKDWKAYQEKVEAIEYPLFKEMKPVKLE